MVITREEPDPGLPWLAVLWRGLVVGVVVGAAQFAISLPQAGAGSHERGYYMLLAMYLGLPAAGLLVGGVAADLLRLKRPALVALLGLVLSIGLALMTLWLGVPHVTKHADPSVLTFGAICEVPGYAAAALIVGQPRKVSGPLRWLGVLAAAVAVVVAGSLAWLEVAYLMRAQTLRNAGVPFVAAEIPGHQLSDVSVSSGGGLELHYSRLPEYTGVSLHIRPSIEPPRNCTEARKVFHDPKTAYTCQEMGDRWVLERPGTGERLVVAAHANAVVTLTGEEPGLTQATLRTSSARELAKAPPGWN